MAAGGPKLLTKYLLLVALKPVHEVFTGVGVGVGPLDPHLEALF